jgi:hypothetical protein
MFFLSTLILSALGNLRQELILKADLGSINFMELYNNLFIEEDKILSKNEEILGISAFGQHAINTEALYFGKGYLPVFLTPFPSFLLPFKKPSSLGEEIVRKRGYNTGLPFSAYVESKLNFGNFFFLGSLVVAIVYFVLSLLKFDKFIINIVLALVLVEPNTISIVMFLQLLIIMFLFSRINVRFYNK